MRLCDIADMKTYLSEKCYYPGEIYDYTGIAFQKFTPETECEYLSDEKNANIHGDFVIATIIQENAKPQVLYIIHDNGKVRDVVRYDATEHNVTELRKFMKGEVERIIFDNYNTPMHKMSHNYRNFWNYWCNRSN